MQDSKTIKSVPVTLFAGEARTLLAKIDSQELPVMLVIESIDVNEVELGISLDGTGTAHTIVLLQDGTWVMRSVVEV